MAWKDIAAAVYADDATLYGLLNPDGTDGFGKIVDKNFEFLKSALTVDGSWDDSDPTLFKWSQLTLKGSSSGTTTLKAAAAAGSTTITFPGGTTDFSATGGTSKVVKQTSAGAAFTVAQLAAADLSDGTTGSGGAVVLATGPTLSAPLLGTPASGNLANCTGLPVGSITGLGTGVATFLATPSSANLRGALTDETGGGAAVFADTPTLVTPVLGVATGTRLGLGQAADGSAVLAIKGVNPQLLIDTTGAGVYPRLRASSNGSNEFDISSDGTNLILLGNSSRGVKLWSNGGSATFHITLSSAGAVQFGAYGVGTITSDASGNLTSTSDRRLKEPVGPFTAGLAEILQLHPELYRWTKDSGLDTQNIYAGLYAQDVMPFIPEAIGKNGRGFYTFNHLPVILALINSTHALKAEIDELRSSANLKLKSYDVAPIVGEARVVTSAPEGA